MKKPETLESIVQNGDELAILKGLRIKVAKTIDVTNSGRDVAALSKQIREVSARISEIENVMFDAKKITALDLILFQADLKNKKRQNDMKGEQDEDLDFLLETTAETLEVIRENGEDDNEQEEG